VLQSRLLRPVDRDAFGFRFFRNHAQQVDAQQTVAQFGGLDFNMVRQTERQFEGALSSASRNPWIRTADYFSRALFLFF
jgi:hypothetical protein